MSLDEIAREVGYADASGAYRAIEAGLRIILPEATRDDYRRVEVCMLSEETLEALKPFQDEMVRLSELPAGVIHDEC